jgi:hypothetical protein
MSTFLDTAPMPLEGDVGSAEHKQIAMDGYAQLRMAGSLPVS